MKGRFIVTNILILVAFSLIGCTKAKVDPGAENNSGGNTEGTIQIPLIAGQVGVVAPALTSATYNAGKKYTANTLDSAILMKVNSNLYYSNHTTDTFTLNQAVSGIFTGFKSSNGTLNTGDTITYSILPDANGHSVPVTLTVDVDATSGDVTYTGTFDGIDSGWDGNENSYNFFHIVLHTDDTFDYEQVLFINEHVVADDESVGNGWQWFTYANITGGTSAPVYAGVGVAYLVQMPTSNNSINMSSTGSARYFSFEIKEHGDIFGTGYKVWDVDGLTPEDIIATKDITALKAVADAVDHSVDRSLDGYLYADMVTGDLYSNLLDSMPAWVATWWTDNP